MLILYLSLYTASVEDYELYSVCWTFKVKYYMNTYFIRVLRTELDSVKYPHFGKVQYFRTELLYHGFSILEHPDYPGNYRAKFIALHNKPSMISFVALKYNSIDFEYKYIQRTV